MHHFRSYFVSALLFALPVSNLFAQTILHSSQSSIGNSLPVLLAQNEFDPLSEDEDIPQITPQKPPKSNESAPPQQHAEERDVIDTRKIPLETIETTEKEETDDDKYKKARMAFLFGQYKMAYKVWEPLAQKGHAKSQATLGWMYHTGKGVKKDLTTAREWYEKAAAQNHAIALNNLGVFYEQGLSVHKSLTQAAHYYTEAAEWGYSYAQYNLGVMYENGKGVEKDINLAIYWLQLAALQGVEQAQDELNKLSKSKKADHPNIKIKPDEKSKQDKDGPIWEHVPQAGDASQANSNDSSVHSQLYRKLYHKKVNPAAMTPPPANVVKPSNQPSTDSQVPVEKKPDSTNKELDKTPVNKSSNQGTDSNHATPEQASPANKTDKPAPQSLNENIQIGSQAANHIAEASTALPGSTSKAAETSIDLISTGKDASLKAVEIANEDWIKQQNPQHYTLQVAASNNLEKLLNLAQTSPLAKELAYYKYLRKGKLWYGLVYGSFENQTHALAQSKKLPEDFKDWSPWVRKMAEVQARLVTQEETE